MAWNHHLNEGFSILKDWFSHSASLHYRLRDFSPRTHNKNFNKYWKCSIVSQYHSENSKNDFTLCYWQFTIYDFTPYSIFIDLWWPFKYFFFTHTVSAYDFSAFKIWVGWRARCLPVIFPTVIRDFHQSNRFWGITIGREIFPSPKCERFPHGKIEARTLPIDFRQNMEN